MQSASSPQNINSNTNSAWQNNHGQKLHENGTCISFCYTHYGAHHSLPFSGNNCMHRIPSPPPPPLGKEKPQWGADRTPDTRWPPPGLHTERTLGAILHSDLVSVFVYFEFFLIPCDQHLLLFLMGVVIISLLDGLLIFLKLNHAYVLFMNNTWRYDVMEFPHCFRCFVEEYQQNFWILKRVPIVRHPTSSCTFQVIILTECPTVCGSRACTKGKDVRIMHHWIWTESAELCEWFAVHIVSNELY